GESGSARALRRQGSRPRTAAAGDAGRGERRIRRDWRTDRRSADHAREDREGAAGEGSRQDPAVRARALSRYRLAGNSARAATVGGWRWNGRQRSTGPPRWRARWGRGPRSINNDAIALPR